MMNRQIADRDNEYGYSQIRKTCGELQRVIVARQLIERNAV